MKSGYKRHTVNDAVVAKWQQTVDLISELFRVPAVRRNNRFSDSCQKLLRQFKTIIEQDLLVAQRNGQLEKSNSENEKTIQILNRYKHILSTSNDDLSVAEPEQMRQEGRLRLAANVLENVSEGVVVTDTEARIVYVNPAIIEGYGYTEEELLGRNPRLLKSEHHDAAFYQDMWKALAEKGQWRGEIWNRCKNGEVFPSQMTITALMDEGGKLINYVSVSSDISMVKESQEQLKRQAQYDHLTKLPNRHLLHDRLQQAVRTVKRSRQLLALLLLDLDGFKAVNDTFGHKSGDFLLIQVAERLLGCVRESDTVARLGGDEFVVLLPDCKSVNNVITVTRMILRELTRPFVIEEEDVSISASIGITIYPDDGGDCDGLLKNADTAMYHVKESGKNNFRFFTPSMQEHIVQRLQLISQLRHGLEREEFLIHYQPKLEPDSGRISGMEALVRWQHPDEGLVPPADFIPLAEESSIIIPLGAWVLRQACLQTVAWQKAGLGGLRLSVNISARQFQDEKLVELVADVIRDSGIDPGALELEISESTVMQDVERSRRTLWQLRNMGILLSIDNFGSGYSSLHHLKRLPLDILKIDRSFVMDISKDPNDRVLVEAVVSLSRHLKMKVVAEGVETEEQLAFLEREQCHEIQGDYFSRPLSADDFAEFVQQYQKSIAATSASTVTMEKSPTGGGEQSC